MKPSTYPRGNFREKQQQQKKQQTTPYGQNPQFCHAMVKTEK